MFKEESNREEQLNYHSFSGTKLEYSETSNGTYTQIKGITQVPDIGSEPEDIETTTMDNKKYKTSIPGLQDVQKYTFEFNMEDPTAESNIKLASDLEDEDTPVFWKLTYSNGITISFKSKVTTMIKGGSTGDLLGFSMTLNPIGEPEKTIPIGS